MIMITTEATNNEIMQNQNEFDPSYSEWRKSLDECLIMHHPTNILECISYLRKIQETTDILLTADFETASLKIDMDLPDPVVTPGTQEEDDADDDMYEHDGSPDYFIDINSAYRLNLEYLSGITARHLHDLVHSTGVAGLPVPDESNEEFLMRLMHNYEQHIKASDINRGIRRLCPID